MEFEKIFIKETDAINFANHVGGKIVIRYDYDVIHSLIEEFVVMYKE